MAPEFAIGLMDQLGIQKAILVGRSAGGSVVLPTVNDGILLCLNQIFRLLLQSVTFIYILDFRRNIADRVGSGRDPPSPEMSR